MRKWLMRLSTITIVFMLLKSHQGLINSVSNFMIDGVIPFSNQALGGFLSTMFIIACLYFVYKSVVNLRFDMLKRRAILYNQQQNNILSSSQSKLHTANQSLVQTEDLALAQHSL